MATRGDWKLGANGCQGASWSDERFRANNLTATPRGGLLLSGRLRTSRTQDPLSPYGMLKSVLVCCCRQYCNVPCDHSMRLVNRSSSLPLFP